MGRAVIVGVGQIRRNPKLDGPFEPMEPAVIMAASIEKAIADAKAQGDATADAIPTDATLLAFVDPVAWTYDDLGATLIEKANLRPGTEAITVPPGGNSPGELLDTIANRIAAGELKVAILTGCETVYGRRRARKEGRTLDWTPFTAKVDVMKGQPPMTNPVEARHGLLAPIHLYPLFENALRHRNGSTVAEHQAFLGRFMARNAAVAATNPYAWFPVAYSPDDIAVPSPENRMVCFPYPKRMNAIMEVDLAASVIVMDSDEATRRGIPVEKQVYFLGGASAVDGWSPSDREDMVSSPAIKAAATKAFEHAGITASDIDLFDFYSCFPCAVELALDAIGVATDDPRGATVTGGLAYAGGPGNSYAMHGLAVMTERLRDPADPATTGLVTSLGMTATKHAYNVLSTDPAKVAKSSGTATKIGPVPLNPPTLVDERSGDATIESYTAEYDRDGNVSRTIYMLRFNDGSRTFANGPCTEEEVRALTTEDLVGRRGHVTAGKAGDAATNVPNRFELAR